MRGVLIAAALLVGCTNVTNVYVYPDAGGDGPALDEHVHDMAISPPIDAANVIDADQDLFAQDLQSDPPDMTPIADLTTPPPPPDLIPPPPPDLALYPGCGVPGLPTGASCQNNTQCCHGLCSSATNLPPYNCCYARNTNCSLSSDCCSGNCNPGNHLCL